LVQMEAAGRFELSVATAGRRAQYETPRHLQQLHEARMRPPIRNDHLRWLAPAIRSAPHRTEADKPTYADGHHRRSSIVEEVTDDLGGATVRSRHQMGVHPKRRGRVAMPEAGSHCGDRLAGVEQHARLEMPEIMQP